MKKLAYIFILSILPTICFSQHIAEFRGQGRMGVFNETGLLKEWPSNGPELILKADSCGKGYSSPVYYRGNIYITGIKGDTLDVCTAFDLEGNLLWETAYGRSWIRTYSDTRSTPTIEDGVIYLASGSGEVVAIDSKDGEIKWSVSAHEEFSGMYHRWGIAESVLLTDDAVLYTTGGDVTSVIALKKTDGSLLWKTKSLGGERAYASPVLIEWNGKKQVIAQTTKYIFGIGPDDGRIAWKYDLQQYHAQRFGRGNNTNVPLFSDGEIFVTSGYNHPGVMLQLAEDANSVELKWMNDTLDTHHGGVVLFDGNIYGSNWQSNSKGNWASLNWATGKVNWEAEWKNKGAVVAADGMLYCCEEKTGTVALVKPDVTEFKIISTFQVEAGSGPFWCHPFIAGGMLFLRHGNVMSVYNIKM